ncbi:hypothetical protein [Niastella populi]|uniref:Uncharacterized protein n=1 Tax=Niastella populi TaxID=550983 RepID=A0A1V9FKY5_9BACT|nr:hypothetical protein [Niastella populi]OQP59039.1 hypothetical protein A4R26_21870 [Niastella populi]
MSPFFDVSLIFIAELFFAPGPALEVQDRFSMTAAMPGIILTGIYLLGILAKSKKQLLGIEIESLVIIITYIPGIILLYFM